MATQKRYRTSRALDNFRGATMGFASAIFVIAFVWIFGWSFLTACIFHVPFRVDVGTCWNEQVRPAQMKAINEAAHFVPGGAFYKR